MIGVLFTIPSFTPMQAAPRISNLPDDKIAGIDGPVRKNNVWLYLATYGDFFKDNLQSTMRKFTYDKMFTNFVFSTSNFYISPMHETK